MKKLLTIFMFTCGFLSTFSLRANIAEMEEIMRLELQKMSVNASTSKKSETYVVKYLTASDGSYMHFGIWSDCIIGTVVANAPNVGNQLIMLPSGAALDGSSDYSKKSDHFINKYPWGKVSSWDYKQVIERK